MVLQSTSSVNLPPEEMRLIVFNSIQNQGDRIFLIDGLKEVELSYRELYEKATSVAISFMKYGIGDGSIVSIISDNTIDAHIVLTGALLTGATLSPMNPYLRPEDIRQLLDISSSKFIFCQDKFLELLELALEGSMDDVTVVTDASSSSYLSLADMVTEDPSNFEMGTFNDEESTAFLLFTSGTTGVPKGVMISGFSIKTTIYRMMFPRVKFLTSSPLYWVSYVSTVMWALTSGGTLVVPGTKYIEGTNIADLSHILACVEKYKPQAMFSGPSVLLEMCTLPSCTSYDLSSLVKVPVGGANLIPSQRKLICDQLFNGRNILFNTYGTTEVGIVTCWLGDAPDHDAPEAASVGVAGPSVALKVLDVAEGTELGPGEEGELWVKSDSIMTGYINEDLPTRYTPDDWYCTGDLCYYDDNGFVYFSSRLKEIIKYRGYQIAPVEIEKVILQHPDVVEACVVGRPHDIDGDRPAAFVIMKEDSDTKDELLDFIHERVSNEKKLRGGLFFVDEIPKSIVGKTLRRDLVKRLEEMDE